jgi:hypothetical protein
MRITDTVKRPAGYKASNLSLSISAFIILYMLFVVGCKKMSPDSDKKFKVYEFSNNMVGYQGIKLNNNTFVAAAQGTDSFDLSGYLLCVDRFCNKQWQVQLPHGVLFSSIAATSDGGFVVGGYSPFDLLFDDGGYYGASNSSTVYLIHFNSSGVATWTDSLNEPYITGSLALCTAGDGSIEVATVWGVPDSQFNINLINVSLAGQVNSIKQIDNGDEDSIYTPQRIVAAGNDFIITGPLRVVDTSGYNSFGTFTLRTANTGSTLWQYTTIGSGSYKLGEDICVGSGSSIIVANDSENDSANYNGGNETYRGNELLIPLYTISFDFFDASSGNLTKTMVYPTENVSWMPFISSTSDNGCMIVATNNISFYQWHVMMMKTDGAGNQQWQQTINIPYPARAFGAIQTDDGGYMVFATVQTFGSNTNSIAFIKTDANGKLSQ